VSQGRACHVILSGSPRRRPLPPPGPGWRRSHYSQTASRRWEPDQALSPLKRAANILANRPAARATTAESSRLSTRPTYSHAASRVRVDGPPTEREQVTAATEQACRQWPVWVLGFSEPPCSDRRSWSPRTIGEIWIRGRAGGTRLTTTRLPSRTITREDLFHEHVRCPRAGRQPRRRARRR
jgi:hypothetical protein